MQLMNLFNFIDLYVLMSYAFLIHKRIIVKFFIELVFSLEFIWFLLNSLSLFALHLGIYMIENKFYFYLRFNLVIRKIFVNFKVYLIFSPDIDLII